jgi:hypothetical protein
MGYTEKELERMRRSLGIRIDEYSKDDSGYLRPRKVKKIRKKVAKKKTLRNTLGQVPPTYSNKSSNQIKYMNSPTGRSNTHVPKLKTPEELEKLLQSYTPEPVKLSPRLQKMVDRLEAIADEED